MFLNIDFSCVFFFFLDICSFFFVKIYIIDVKCEVWYNCLILLNLFIGNILFNINFMLGLFLI